MLPEHLTGSYARYKEDTTVAATWIFHNARAAGYHRPTTPAVKPVSSNMAVVENKEPKLKGRARMEAKAAAAASAEAEKKQSSRGDHLLTTKEIIAQANHIAKKTPPITMPLAIYRVLLRAIQARRRCWAWYKSKEEALGNTEKNASHEYFIKTLENALEILKPCCEKPKRGTATEPEADDDYLSNRFEGLEVEDIDEVDLDIMATDDIAAAPKAKKNTKKEVFELERNIDDELPFIIFCFFEDLQKMRGLIKEAWAKVASGEIKRTAASLATNVAIELARNADKDLLALCPQLLRKENQSSWGNMVGQMHPGVSMDDIFDNDILNDEVIFGPTAILIWKYCCNIDGKNWNVPSLLVALKASYQQMHCGDSNFEILEEEFLDTLKNNADWFSDGEHLMKDDNLLSEILLSCQLDAVATAIKEKGRQKGIKLRSGPNIYRCSAYEDEATKALMTIVDGKWLSAWVVFAIQVLLDINSYKPDSVDPYKELLCRGAAADKALGMEWGDSISETICKKELLTTREELNKAWGNTDNSIRPELLSFMIHSVIKENFAVRWKMALGEMEPSVKRENYISRPQDPAFLLNKNPIYCDLEGLRVSIGMEKTGVSEANRLGSFIATAHFYNAVDQLGLLKEMRWPAMDAAIQIHISQLFKGGTPSDGEVILKRFNLCCVGVGAAAFSNQYRGTPLEFVKLLRKNKHAIHGCELSTTLESYLEGECSAEQLLHKVNSERHKHSKQRKSLNRLEMLRQVFEYTSEVLPALETDFLSMTRDCSELLLRIRKEHKTKLNIDHYDDGKEYCELLPLWNIPCVLDLLYDRFQDQAPQSQRYMPLVRSDGHGSLTPFVGTFCTTGNNFSIGVDVLKEFLRELSLRPDVEPLVVVPGPSPPPNWQVPDEI